MSSHHIISQGAVLQEAPSVSGGQQSRTPIKRRKLTSDEEEQVNEIDGSIKGHKREAQYEESSAPGESLSKRPRLAEQDPGSPSTSSEQSPDVTSATTDEKLENQVNELVCIFGDCDPEYIRTSLMMRKDDPNRLAFVKNKLRKTYNKYPLLRDKLRKQHMEELRTNLQTMEPSCEEFAQRLDIYGSLLKKRTWLQDKDKDFLRHAFPYLANTFSGLNPQFVRRTILSNTTLKRAYDRLSEMSKRKARDLRSSRSLKPEQAYQLPFPDVPSEEFYWEKCYIENQPKIDEYIATKTEQRLEQIREARAAGTMLECLVCLEDTLPCDILTCAGCTHRVCVQCLRRYATHQVQSCGRSVGCPGHGCSQVFSPATLRKVLPTELCERIDEQLAQEELSSAQIERLESCPRCRYAVIFPEDCTQSVLQCYNPKCLASTCRFCKRDSHVMFSCGDRRDVGDQMRLYVEEMMTEAVIRTCNSCGTRFVKEGGCNTMTCGNCQLRSCYYCGHSEKNPNSTHLKGYKCRTVSDADVIHKANAKRAFKEAVKDFKKNNPNASKVHMDSNPLMIWN